MAVITEHYFHLIARLIAHERFGVHSGGAFWAGSQGPGRNVLLHISLTKGVSLQGRGRKIRENSVRWAVTSIAHISKPLTIKGESDATGLGKYGVREREKIGRASCRERV